MTDEWHEAGGGGRYRYVKPPPTVALGHLLDLHDRGVSWQELTDDEKAAFLAHLADLMEWADDRQ